jgi:hypothetical protein
MGCFFEWESGKLDPNKDPLSKNADWHILFLKKFPPEKLAYRAYRHAQSGNRY